MAKILVVDDKPINREYLHTLLGYGGHHVLEARGGLEALALVRTAKPSLVIVDIVMPVMDGYEFVHKLRSDPAGAQTPVIFYTASYLEKEARQLADMCNVRFIIIKPAEPQEILEKVKVALADHKPLPVPPTDEEFGREHLRTLTDKLSDKIVELEVLNTELEKRVKNRTEELVAANARLKELNRLKDEFIMIVSHDLRSPVGGIQMIVDVLREKGDKLPAPTRARFLDAMSDAAGRLIELVNNLIDLVKIEAGKANLDLTDFRISDVVRDSLKTVEIPANAKQIAVELEVSPDEPGVRMDRLKLSQIFNTLFINAVRNTPKTGKLMVAVRRNDGEIRVSLAEASREYRQDTLEKTKRDGVGNLGDFSAGLGMAIVRSFVELHGGRIDISKDSNHGRIMTVCLPQIINPKSKVNRGDAKP